MPGPLTARYCGSAAAHRIALAITAASLQVLAAAPLRAQTPAAVPVAEAPRASLPLFPLRVRWTADLGAPPAAAIAADEARVYVPISTGALLAVDADGGSTVWRADLTTTVAPVAADGRVYVVGDGVLQALDGPTGRAIWRVPLPAAASAPLVARAGWVVAGLASGEVLALRGVDGTIVWRQSFATSLAALPAINGDRLYLPGADGTVRALLVRDGSPVWSRTLGGGILGISPLGARVYVGSADNYFYCLDDASGRVRWRWRAGADPVGLAVADDDRVFFTAMDTVVRALDRGHGAQRWRRPLPWRPRGGPLRVGTTLVASGIALDLRGYALDTGQPVGEFALSESKLEVLEGQPVIVTRRTLPGDFLVVAVGDGRLLALEHVFRFPATPPTMLPGEAMA
ncbi:MAG: PQQ-binding-like beta-propeller repeat protein, partial [Luteitalea sp.]